MTKPLPPDNRSKDAFAAASASASAAPVEVSVVLPCLNEVETLRNCIEAAQEAMRDAGIDGEVIVADNGSTDGSREVAQRLGARVVAVAERGYGSAVVGGCNAAAGLFIVMADADASYDLHELHRFVAALRNGAQFVMGSRFPRHGGRIEPGAMPLLNRWVGTPILTAIGRLFFRTTIGDVNCGMRGLRRDVLDALDLRMTGMELASEMVLKAAMLGLTTVEVPVTLRRAGRSRLPHLRPWRDGWRHLRMMLLYSPRWLFGVPSLLLLSAGLAGITVLAAGPVRIGSVTFDTNTLVLSAVLLLVGAQLGLLGVIANAFVVEEHLLPMSQRTRQVVSGLRLEHGILAGAALVLSGSVLVLSAVVVWQRMGFGGLSGTGATRLVIFGATAVILGIQIVAAGFLLGVLRLRHRPSAASPSSHDTPR